jgi:hypothetical protein
MSVFGHCLYKAIKKECGVFIWSLCDFSGLILVDLSMAIFVHACQ